MVKEDNKTDRPTFLDELLLRTPSIAVNESRSMTVRMANLARTSVLQAVSLFDTFDHKAADQILETNPPSTGLKTSLEPTFSNCRGRSSRMPTAVRSPKSF